MLFVIDSLFCLTKLRFNCEARRENSFYVSAAYDFIQIWQNCYVQVRRDAAKDMQPNVDYQIGTIPEGFRPIVNTYEYKKYNANRECRVVINNDGTASIRFFDDVATTVGININMTYIAE